MTIIRASSLPFSAGTVLNEIAFRRDAVHATPYVGRRGRIKVQLGIARPGNIDHPTTSFDLNYASTPTFVLDETKATSDIVPAVGVPSGTPGFDLRLVFARPWQYPGGDLVVDIFHVGATAGEWRRDAVFVPDGEIGDFSFTRPGCPGSNGRTPRNLARPETAVPGGTLTLELFEAMRPAGGVAGFAINLVGLDGNSHSGLPLPFDLHTIGFPVGCWLATSIGVSQLVATQPSAAGYGHAGTASAQAQYPLPGSPSLTSVQLWSQWLCADFSIAAPIGLTVSNAIRITLGEPATGSSPIAQTIWSYGAKGGEVDSGTVAAGTYVPVIEFR
ncbi:MAG: hypothetical protein AB8H80_10470 [Planctomycetota bacterium]